MDVMIALTEHGQAYDEVFNIGHTKDVSIYDLVLLVKRSRQRVPDSVHAVTVGSYPVTPRIFAMSADGAA